MDSVSLPPSEHREAADRYGVYLTFDDGPNPLCTPDVLDVLAEHRVPATFCVVGAYAASHPRLIRRMIAEGHEVANHTMSHPDLSQCEPAEIQYEIAAASRVIKTVCPEVSLRHMRAPYGVWTGEALGMIARAGLAPLRWSVDPKDWSRPGVDAIVGEVLAAVQPDAIILLHDGCPPEEMGLNAPAGRRDQTLKALTCLIPALHARGFEIRLLPPSH